jgi:signal transduction histidine kinase
VLSLRMKLMLAFLGVTFVAVGLLGLLVGRATSSAFEDYLVGRETSNPGVTDHQMKPEGPKHQQMLEQMLGPAERAYLAAVRKSVWLTAGLVALAAVGLSLLLARQIAKPVRALTAAARRMGSGDFDQRVPVRTRDELGELAEAFNSMAEAVGRQEMLRRQLAADIAHELRTPLSVIQADLEAMLDGIRPLRTKEIADVHQETRLLIRLVADLQDLSLAEAGQLPLKKEPTDLGVLARASVARFSSRAEEKEIRLTVDTPDNLPPVEADQDRISQVLGNLLDNALRHAPPRGEVTVKLESDAEQGRVQLTVHDTGPGIPTEHLPNVFERFYRADRARSRVAGGSGIGLAVVKQLVKAHGGQIWAESPTGGGTSFALMLPTSKTDSTLNLNGGRNPDGRFSCNK